MLRTFSTEVGLLDSAKRRDLLESIPSFTATIPYSCANYPPDPPHVARLGMGRQTKGRVVGDANGFIFTVEGDDGANHTMTQAAMAA